MNFRDFVSGIERKWPTGKLGDHFDLKNGVNFSSDQRGSGILTLDVKNMYSGDSFVDPAGLYRVDIDPGERVLTDGDILFVRSSVKREGVGWASAFRTFDEPVTFCGFLIRARPKNEAKFDSRFLVYYLRLAYVRDQLISSSGQVAITNISQDNLAKLPIPLPPLAEQKRIAGILDAADALRAKRRESLAQLDALLQSTFLHLFGDPVTNPMGWEKTELADLVEDGDKINYGVVQPGDEWPTGKPLVRVGDFVGGELDFSAIKMIDPEIEKKYRRSRLNGRELLVSCVGSIGTVCKVPREAASFNIARAVARIPLQERISRDFMLYCLRSDAVQRHFLKETRTVSQPTLNIGLIKTAPVIHPPLSLQRRFAGIVESVERQKARLLAHLAELDALFASLQHRAFRGEL